MTSVVFSPHCDDAIWSLGGMLIPAPATRRDDVLIVAVMAGMPDDPVGRAKYETIHAEHKVACDLLDAATELGPFLDDVYPDAPRDGLSAWLASFLPQADRIFIPVGTHHPDHVVVADLLVEILCTYPELTPPAVWFYEELPYRVEYPALAAARRERIIATLGGSWHGESITPRPRKRDACVAYASQTNHFGTETLDSDLVDKLMTTERIWEWTR